MALKTTLHEAMSVGDVLDTSQHEISVLLPTLPSGAPFGRSDWLRIQTVASTLPSPTIPHIEVYMYGTSVLMRGGAQLLDKQFSITYLDATDGHVTSVIRSWMDAIADLKREPGQGGTGGSSLPWSKCKTKAVSTYFDTTGEPSVAHSIEGVWPIAMHLPPETEQSAPYYVTVIYGCDHIDFIPSTRRRT